MANQSNQAILNLMHNHTNNQFMDNQTSQDMQTPMAKCKLTDKQEMGKDMAMGKDRVMGNQVIDLSFAFFRFSFRLFPNIFFNYSTFWDQLSNIYSSFLHKNK